MNYRLQDRWQRWQHGLVKSFAGDHDPATRVMLLAMIGTFSMPLYYVLWHFFMPQEYESLLLRLVGIALCAAGMFARRFSRRMLDLYLLLALTYVIPFFFTFMFLMNHASAVWTQSLLIGLIMLFHFDIRIACVAYLAGTATACVAVIALGRGAVLLDASVLQQLPIHWFAISVISVLKVGRKVMEQERLAGLGSGLASVAHELRTPLSSVLANTRGLQRLLQQCVRREQSDPVGAREALARIEFEVRHMNHMIDLFLLSASAVKRSLRPNATLSMAQAVESVLQRYPFTGPAQRQSVALQVRRDFVFAGQSELCAVVLLNLLRNAFHAIQRAGKGRIRIVVDGARERPRLLFIDTGCGIAASHLPLIFQRFYSYPAHNGTGIGLALCKDIVEAWQARIRCLSRETAYAIFILEFPRPAPSAAAMPIP